jgi:hypothetical protein
MELDPVYAGGGDMFSLLIGSVLVLLGGPSHALPLAAIVLAGLII